MRTLVLGFMAVLVVASCASAASEGQVASLWPDRAARNPWSVVWLPASSDASPAALPQLRAQPLALSLAVPSTLFQGDAQPLHTAAVEHSEAYETRAKIHKYASFATLPLLATELALGQSIYNNSTNVGTRKAAHILVGTGIMGLFGVNTVTGAWNMFGEEGRADTNGRMLRLVHGLLMMAADVGFVATSMTGPNSGSQRQALTFETSKATHRNLAVASISVATVGYLVMLIGNH